jgi:hypothetical protein
MDKEALVDDKYDEGKKLIEELDKQGRLYPIIIWINDPEKNDWLLLFGIPELRKTGAKEVFTVIHQIITKNHIKLSLNSITLIDTTAQLCKDLRTMIKTGNVVGRISFFGNIINGRKFPDSIVYRVN